MLFADIVGFTRLSERLPASEVVALLDRVFASWDLLAAEYGVEKIKTIGDSPAWPSRRSAAEMKRDRRERHH